MQVSIWPITIPPPGQYFFLQNLRPQDSFPVQNSSPGWKKQNKNPHPRAWRA